MIKIINLKNIALSFEQYKIEPFSAIVIEKTEWERIFRMNIIVRRLLNKKYIKIEQIGE